jgi:hypothetical protein
MSVIENILKEMINALLLSFRFVFSSAFVCSHPRIPDEHLIHTNMLLQVQKVSKSFGLAEILSKIDGSIEYVR